MANTFRQDSFRPATVPGYVAMALLGAVGICSALYFILSIAMVVFADATIDLGEDGSINAPLVAAGLVAILEVPLRIASIVTFLIWLHCAYGNLSPLKARNLEFSPGWAVGWWFIPFANLVKPFQVVRELYNESDPDVDPYSGFSSVPAGTPAVIGFWWGTFLLGNMANRVADAAYGNGEIPEADYFPVIFMIAGILNAIAAAMAIYIIWAVTKRQGVRALRIGEAEMNSFTPPPPPSFGDNR